MREETGQLTGDMEISEPLELLGSIFGNVVIKEGGKVYIRGAIYGDLRVTDGGRVHVYGNVTGNLTVEEGAKVIISGVVGGNAANHGGRLYVDEMATIIGKVKRFEGETHVSRKARIGE